MSEIFDDTPRFTNASVNVKLERAARLENAKDILTFGVPFLDDCFGGIMKNDLIVYGARTGAGKTELAAMIGGANARKGKRVHMFALEAERYEVERRLKYQILAELFYKELRVSRSELRSVHLNYQDWYQGKLDHLIGMYEPEIEDIIADKYSNLNVLYPDRNYFIENFEREVLAIENEVDLIIIDHLHYFDLDENQNENAQITRITKRIRELSLQTGKPVVLVVHLRKTDKRSKELVPDETEFHGSSNIPKIATKIFTMAKSRTERDEKSFLMPTYIRPVKCRTDGSRTMYVADCMFNRNVNQYEPAYRLGQLSFDGSEMTQSTEIPHWAKKPTPPQQPQLKGFTHVK